MLTQNYRAMYQYQGGPEIYSIASEGSVQICHDKNSYQGVIKPLTIMKLCIPTCIHSISQSATSLEAQHCIPALVMTKYQLRGYGAYNLLVRDKRS